MTWRDSPPASGPARRAAAGSDSLAVSVGTCLSGPTPDGWATLDTVVRVMSRGRSIRHFLVNIHPHPDGRCPEGCPVKHYVFDTGTLRARVGDVATGTVAALLHRHGAVAAAMLQDLTADGTEPLAELLPALVTALEPPPG